MSGILEKDGKTLYHVQSVTDWHDDPYDMFVWGTNQYEVQKHLRKLYKNDYGEIDRQELNDLVDNSNVYTVYPEEV
jgi:hypothetical protein